MNSLVSLLTADFLPRGTAFFWQPGILWLQVIANLVTAMALIASVVLLARMRPKLPTGIGLRPAGLLLLLLAAAFVLEVWLNWIGLYRLETLLKIAIAAVAAYGALSLWRRLPNLLAAPDPQQLAQENVLLRRELEELRQREAEHAAERASLEQRAEEQQEAAERSEQNLEQYSYTVSHDLQEPLRMVVGFTQLIQKRYRDQLDNEGREFVDLTVQSASRMSNMLADLLRLSRVGREEIPQQPVSLQQALDQAIAPLEPSLESAHAQLEIEELPAVRGHEALLSQVFQHLLDNALKFRTEQPLRIKINAERQDDTWKITLRDNGIGMDPKFADRVFQPFQRLHTIEEYPGTGIGLALVQRIIERHGGRVGVESAPGQGACFWFTLPA